LEGTLEESLGVTEGEVAQVVAEEIQRLNDPNPRIRESAAWTLGAMASSLDPDIAAERPVAVPALVTTLEDQDYLVREAAAWAMMNMAQSRDPHLLAGLPVAVPALIGVLEDQNSAVREAAVRALDAMVKSGDLNLLAAFPGAVPALVRALRSQAPTVRLLVVSTLGTMALFGDPDILAGLLVAVPALVRALGDQNSWVRRGAARALQAMARSGNPGLQAAVISDSVGTDQGGAATPARLPWDHPASDEQERVRSVTVQVGEGEPVVLEDVEGGLWGDFLRRVAEGAGLPVGTLMDATGNVVANVVVTQRFLEDDLGDSPESLRELLGREQTVPIAALVRGGREVAPGVAVRIQIPQVVSAPTGKAGLEEPPVQKETAPSVRSEEPLFKAAPPVLEEVQAVFDRLLKEPTVEETLRIQGWVSLDTDRARAFGYPARRGVILRDSAPVTDAAHFILSAERLGNNAAEKVFPWVKEGEETSEVVEAAKRLPVQRGDLIGLEETGLEENSVGPVDRLLAEAGLKSVRTLMGTVQEVEALSAFSFQLFADPDQKWPSVIVLSVVLRLRDAQGNACTLILMA
jgi:hypothetical protein